MSSITIAGLAFVTAAWADQPARRLPQNPLVGEIREVAVSAPSGQAVARLHEQGWIEAGGELLSTKEYPELFSAIGRTWTSDGVPEDRFAVPDIKDPGRISSANPFGVMGPGDLVVGGRNAKSWLRAAPISYWIYAGRTPAAR